MSTVRAILDGFGTLNIDPSPRLRRVRAEMEKAQVQRRKVMAERYLAECRSQASKQRLAS